MRMYEKRQPNIHLMIMLGFGALMFVASCRDNKPDPPSTLGATTYETYCTGCHGRQLEGGLATALIKTEWTYGRDRSSIVRNIKFGVVGTEMTAWRDLLSEEEMDAVADYVIAAQTMPPAADRPIPAQIETEHYVLKVEQLVNENIGTPWGIEFVDEHRALISEREGGLRWMVDDVIDPEPVRGLPATYNPSQSAGYMDIALDPDYANNGWVYLAYSFTEDTIYTMDALGMTKVVRGRIVEHEWIDEQVLLEAPDSMRVHRGNRWGCRFLFDQEGYLYFTVGDMAQGDLAQDLTKIPGKVYRIHPDGSIPSDNPFVQVPGALGGIYSLGNRNVQGIVQDPNSGTIWMVEHGPMGGDELNILKKGANYGWPLVTFGIDYSGDTVSLQTEMEGLESPVTYWTPSIAVCPLEFCVSPLFPKWDNNLFVGALAYEEMRRLTVVDEQVTEQEMLLKGLGRVRDIKFGPEGALYVLINKPDMVLRMTPEM